VLQRAAEEARRLRQNWLGPEHYLLAVLAEPGPAAAALAELGVTHDRVAAHLARQKEAGGRRRPYVEARGVKTNPAAHDASGWAAGYAAASGRRQPAAEDWLLGVLYAGHGGAILHQLGISAGAVVDVLRRRGIRTPEFEPPQERPWRGLRTAEVARSEWRAVVDLLGQRHPPGSDWRWGFNSRKDRPGKVQLVAEEGIDLEAIVAEARGARNPGAAG
jgi:ATP-dependent Clp protease ATP-binding subunit ClpA